jgi:acetyl-CoA C-acetyltransferase
MRLADRPFPYPGITHFRAKKFASEQAYKMAGIKNPAKELDCFEVHDAYSGVELVSCEDLRLCGYGQSGKLYEEGYFDLGGELPVNTSGGLIGMGHPVGATGLNQGIEIMTQLREEAHPQRQVEIINGQGGMDSHGGTGTFVAVNIFRRVD